jgi:1-phosphatidylinositol-3-phosphate 5-kinase
MWADLLHLVVMSLCLGLQTVTICSSNSSRSASTILPHFGNLEQVRVCDGCRPAAEKHESLRLSRTPTIEDDRASVSRYRSPTATHDMPPTPTSSLRHYRPSGMRPRHSRLSTSNSLPEIHDERSPIGAGSRGSPYAQSPIDEEARSVGHQRRPSQEAMPSGVPPRADRQIEAGAAAESDEMYAEGAQSPTLSTATAPFRRSLGDEEHPASSSDSPIEAVDTSAEPSPADSPVLHGLGLDLNDALHDDMDEKSSPFGGTAPVLPRGVSFLPAQELHGGGGGGGGGERGLPVLGRSDSRLSGHLIDSLPETPFDMSGIDPDVYHFDAFRAAEAMEVPLSQASTAHIQRTIRQTLVREHVPSVDAWAPVLESLLYDVADRLAMLDEVEVGNFALHDHVRVKRIPGGRPRDSEFVSGVVITKNVMHKSMARHLSNPRIMLVSFPLEYQRNDGQYLSLDKVHAQERQYLETLAVRIQHSVPHIVLAQRNVSQVALEQLKDRGIVVARHVKASALASLSHSFGAEIISSTNGLLDPRIGKCRSFRVQTFVHPKIPGGRKTFLRFEGDSRSNCTIVLRGGSMEDLAKVKRIIHTLVLVVYNAKLEGYLLHDEHVEARVPPIPIARGPISPGEHPKTGTSDEPEENAMAGDLMKDPELSQSFQPYEEVELTGSALVHYPPPYSLQRVAEDSRRVRELRMQRDAEEAQRILEEETNAKLKPASSSSSSITEPLSVEPTSLATPHAISDAAEEQSLASAASSVVDLQLDRPEDLARQALVDEAESAQAQHLAEWKAYSVSAPESFDLRDHQRLFVLESLLLYGDGEPSRLCRPPEVRAIAFYRDTDTTIGQYLRKADAAFQSNEPCPSPTCNEPLHRHTRVFVHDQFILRVAWEEWNNDILHGAIGLSSTCRREGCHCASRLVRASAETSRLSLGRFFDLSFHPSGAFKCLDESCGHDGQADHVRYWHFGRVRVSITMDEIDLRDVVAPPRQVKVRPDRQVELRNAECAQVQHRTQAFFDSVQTRIASFKLDCVAPERQEECQTALAGFSERCEAERRAIEELLRSTYEQAHHSNGIDLINVRRALQERSHAFDADWSAFVKRIVPADFSDFRRASAQLKRIFPEAPASVSPSSRIVSGALPPAIELDEPYDGAEPPPPSPHQATAPDGLERAAEDDHHMASRSELRPGPEQELPVPPEGPVGASGAPVQPPPLSRSSTVRARRPSDGSEDESDSTVCADGEMTATLTFSGSPFIRHHVSPIIDETSAAESERDVPPRRRRNGPQVAALVSAYESGKPQVGSGKSSERPAMRRSATERPQEAPRSRPRPSHAVSDTDSSCT